MGQPGLRIGLVFAVAIVVHAGSAAAQRRGYIEGFLGWSADRTFYAMTSSGTDEVDVPMLCLSKPGTPSPTWPKDVPQPEPDDEDGCSARWDTMFPDDTTDPQQVVDKVRKLVSVAGAGKRGLHGETYSVRRVSGEIIEIAVSRGGKRLARGFIELKFPTMPVPDDVDAYWRDDGAAVAVVVGYAPVKDPPPGYGPPRYLLMFPLDGSTANAAPPLSSRQRAQALNVEGLKLLTAKSFAAAQQKFHDAVGEDDSFALAYYNLACAASLNKDGKAALDALRHLADVQNGDPIAKKALAKGATDHDLDFVATDPEGAKLLKRRGPSTR